LCENDEQINQMIEKCFENKELINSAHLHFIMGFCSDLQIFVLGTKRTKDKALNLLGNKEYKKFKANFLKLTHKHFQNRKKILFNLNLTSNIFVIYCEFAIKLHSFNLYN